jgi:hypothetical protein
LDTYGGCHALSMPPNVPNKLGNMDIITFLFFNKYVAPSVLMFLTTGILKF